MNRNTISAGYTVVEMPDCKDHMAMIEFRKYQMPASFEDGNSSSSSAERAHGLWRVISEQILQKQYKNTNNFKRIKEARKTFLTF